jgi:hypothetical protein
MHERCNFHRSTIAIENASIDYTVFIPLSPHRRVIAASHAHRSRNCKLSLTCAFKARFHYCDFLETNSRYFGLVGFLNPLRQLPRIKLAPNSRRLEFVCDFLETSPTNSRQVDVMELRIRQARDVSGLSRGRSCSEMWPLATSRAETGG